MDLWFSQLSQVTWSIVSESALWVLISLFFAGLIHEFLPASYLKRLLNRDGIAATGGAVALGGVLPICSCGVIPIAVSLYKSGVRIGPVMAFTAATPIINPAAVILSFALLGTHITLAYILLGLSLPFILGAVSERFAGDRHAGALAQSCDQATSCCGADGLESTHAARPILTRLRSGLSWAFLSLGPTIGFYLAIGVLLAGVLSTSIPTEWIKAYLGADSFVGLFAAGVLGATIYVCAVAHIPLVATLLASGAGPGAAIVFLVTGTATNLPELFTLYKTIGKRIVIIYTITLIVASLFAGVLVNLWLGENFVPAFDPLASLDLVEKGEGLWLTPPSLVNSIAAYIVVALATRGFWLHIGKRLAFRKSDQSTAY